MQLDSQMATEVHWSDGNCAMIAGRQLRVNIIIPFYFQILFEIYIYRGYKKLFSNLFHGKTYFHCIFIVKIITIVFLTSEYIADNKKDAFKIMLFFFSYHTDLGCLF